MENQETPLREEIKYKKGFTKYGTQIYVLTDGSTSTLTPRGRPKVKILCPHCHQNSGKKHGKYKDGRNRYKCNECKHTWLA